MIGILLIVPYKALPFFLFFFPQKYDSKTFSKVDFKYVDDQPDSQLLKGLKVWPVTEVSESGGNRLESALLYTAVHLYVHVHVHVQRYTASCRINFAYYLHPCSVQIVTYVISIIITSTVQIVTYFLLFTLVLYRL